MVQHLTVFEPDDSMIEVAITAMKAVIPDDGSGRVVSAMHYYFAPMEGVTGAVYRRTHHEFFSGVDKLFHAVYHTDHE